MLMYDNSHSPVQLVTYCDNLNSLFARVQQQEEWVMGSTVPKYIHAIYLSPTLEAVQAN